MEATGQPHISDGLQDPRPFRGSFRITRISEEAGPCSLRSLDKTVAMWADLGGAAGACGQGLVLFAKGFSESQHPGKLSVIL